MVKRTEFYDANDDSDLNLLNNNICQTFTVGNAGTNSGFTLEKIRVLLHKENAGGEPPDLNWSVWDCEGGDQPVTKLNTTDHVMTSADAGASDIWTTLDFSADNIKLSKDGVYAIVNDGTGLAANRTFVWRYDAGDGAYTGGGRGLSSGFIVWTMTPADDLLFEVYSKYTGTLCTYNNVVHKAGVNASSDVQAEGIISDFVEQAESLIIVATRENWLLNYSALTAVKKYLLNMMVSDLAAIYAIDYDTSGYSSRVEAEMMINVLRESSMRALALLLDQKSVTYIKRA